MSNNVNTVAVSGNLTRDPELKLTPSGFPIANVGIAVNRSKKVEEEYVDDVSFFDVTILGKYGELVARKLKKGDLATVQGRLEQQRWETPEGDKRSKVVIIAIQLDSEGFFRSKAEDNDTSAVAVPAEGGTTEEAAAAPASDDIPF